MEAAWPVDELALVRSQLHPTGARYDTLVTFPTTPSTPPA
jgi:2'-5' RNA ligase